MNISFSVDGAISSFLVKPNTLDLEKNLNLLPLVSLSQKKPRHFLIIHCLNIAREENRLNIKFILAESKIYESLCDLICNRTIFLQDS